MNQVHDISTVIIKEYGRICPTEMSPMPTLVFTLMKYFTVNQQHAQRQMNKRTDGHDKRIAPQ